MIYDIDPFVRTDANGIIQAESTDAWMLRLEEWLNTEIGTIYGAPAWGSPIKEFVHEPLGSSTSKNHALEVRIENRVANKLREDMPNFSLQGIRCSADGMDYVTISFMSGDTRYTTQVSLNKA